MSKTKKRKTKNITNKNKNTNVEKNIKEDIKQHEVNSDNKKSFNLKDTMLEYFTFFKENIRKKQIVIFIITVVIFGISICSYISNLDNTDFLQQIQNIGQNQEVNIYKEIFVNKILIAVVLIMAGITPYLYISSLGVFVGHTISAEMISILSTPTHTENIVLMAIGSIIQIIGFSLASANGILWCNITGKRNKYQNSKNKSFLDIKKEIYTLKGDNKKLKELENKRKEKLKNGEKYNIKTPYSMFVISLVISLILILLGTLIFYI